MIRIYFDSDVINNIHAGNLSELEKFLTENRDKFLIPFSAAHVLDKLPSDTPNNQINFFQDLDFISKFCDNKILVYDKKNGCASGCITDARNVLDEIRKEQKLKEEFSNVDRLTATIYEEVLDSDQTELANLWKTLLEMPYPSKSNDTEFIAFKEHFQNSINESQIIGKNPSVYKEKRDELWAKFKLPSNANNWTEDPISLISNEIKKHGEHADFFAQVESSLDEKDRKDRFSYFIQCYHTLNNLGFHSDEIKPKTGKGLMNHLQDGTHCFFGAHCDYFVVKDKKLKPKTVALYKALNIHTKVVSAEELLTDLQLRINPNLFDTVVSAINKNKPVDVQIDEEEAKYLYRLDCFALDYFTHVEVHKPIIENYYELWLRKCYANYSNFMFFEECDMVIRELHKYFNFNQPAEKTIDEFKKHKGLYQFDFLVDDRTVGRLSRTDAEFFLILKVSTVA